MTKLDDIMPIVKRALDRYENPDEFHNKHGGWPRGEIAWAMAGDLREAVYMYVHNPDNPQEER